ncbi:MAG: four helix bundle protein [Dehalococcoidia bacterium]
MGERDVEGGKLEVGNGKREGDSGIGRPSADNARVARSAPIQSYRDIDAYRRAMALLAPLHLLVRKLPDVERFELASQMRRASKSVPANIAEGYGKKRSAKEFKSYLVHALGSANEMVVHLEIAVAIGYVTQDEAQTLIDGYEVVAKQLYRLIQAWRDFASG